MSNDYRVHLRDQNQGNPVLLRTGVGREAPQCADYDNRLRQGFLLNEWQVHPIDGSLADAQGSIHLEPKVMEVLLLLASHPGKLVEREFLISEIWGARTVSDEPLTRCIAVLRRTLGDTPRHPKCIQTVPKRGYRLIAQVSSVRAALPHAPSASTEAEVRLFPAGNQELRHEAFIPDRSVAVLPFENLSSDPDNAFFADGVQDDLLHRLAKIDSLSVISRTSVREYRGCPKNLRKIGQELRVAAIVEGGVRRVGDSVRVNVNLIDARTDQYLWAETYDRQLCPKNVFAIQSEIAAQVTTSLQTELASHQVCCRRTRLVTQTTAGMVSH